jgi:hypothetical protein
MAHMVASGRAGIQSQVRIAGIGGADRREIRSQIRIITIDGADRVMR